MVKRKDPEATKGRAGESTIDKRARPSSPTITSSTATALVAAAAVAKQTTALVTKNNKNQQLIPRTTSLLSAPTLKLTGHGADVLSVQFNPAGTLLASASHDRTVYLWDMNDNLSNSAVLSGGHKNAIQHLSWLSSWRLLTASADKTLGLWDVGMETKTRRFTGHDSFVNACCVVKAGHVKHATADDDAGFAEVDEEGGASLVASASDDGTVKLWDYRVSSSSGKSCVSTLVHSYQVTSVCGSSDGLQVYSGGLDNVIRAWDVRKAATVLEFKGHTDTLSSLALSADGNHILSNSMDNTVRMWDVRPFVADEATKGRCVKVFYGASHGKKGKSLIRANVSGDGRLVTSGGADGCVYVWDAYTAELKYRLPGHKGVVMEAAFHPKANIIASGARDNVVYVGEIA